MKIRNLFIISIILVGFILFGSTPIKAQGMSLKSFMKPAIKDGGFKMDGYFLWCPSVIKVGDTYHLFCSRWPESVGMGGWTTWSECVGATSKNLFGPYKFEEIVLQKRDSSAWDKARVHNVKILKIGSKFVLYYISTKMNTGYAYADKITGPWIRIDKPAMHVTNPAILVKPDNSIYVIGRGETPEKVNIAIAFTAPGFDRTYSILKDGKNVLPNDYELEDPTIWWANNQYNILVNDWKAKATGISKSGAQSSKGNGDLTHWPKGKSPQEIGKLVAERFVATPHTNFNRPTPPKSITYPETCAWYGALTFAKESNNKDIAAQLIKRFEPILGAESSLIPSPTNVDATVFGAVPLELFIQTREQKYLEIGQRIADKQWAKPDTSKVKAYGVGFYEKGFTWQTRLWIDDMFMITAVQTQAYRTTGDAKYITRAAKEMVLYLDSLQRPNGLFYHAPDVPFFWGRGNGWMAAGMSELLRTLPKNNPDRPRIMEGYKKMMEGLLKNQASDGMWRQLIDDQESWQETSGTGMFTFAMITGVKYGWLDKKTYAPAARKAWLALISYLNENSDISDVCEGTNKKNSRQYYLDRKRIVGDLHGQAPVLWCASALLR